MALHRYKVTSQCMRVSTQMFLSAVDGIAQIHNHFSVYVCVYTNVMCVSTQMFLSAVDGIAQIQSHFSVYVCVYTNVS